MSDKYYVVDAVYVAQWSYYVIKVFYVARWSYILDGNAYQPPTTLAASYGAKDPLLQTHETHSTAGQVLFFLENFTVASWEISC